MQDLTEFKPKESFHNCSKCGRKQIYTIKSNWKRAVLNNVVCKSCTMKGKNKKYDFINGVDTTKLCHQCNTVKPITEFRPCKTSSHGYRSSCNMCLKQFNKDKYQKVKGTSFKRRYWQWMGGAKKRHIKWNLDLNYLSQMPLTCSYTNIPLTLEPQKWNTLSLDRIDNEKGYEPGNVCYSLRAINRMKCNLIQNDFLYLCNLVSNHTSGSFVPSLSTTGSFGFFG